MSTQNWKIIGASAVGTSHLAKAENCQDAFAFCTTGQNETETLIVAVSDGAGSAKNGFEGAQTACELFIDGARAWFESNQQLQHLNKDYAVSFLEQLQNKLTEKARGENQSLADYACTFLGAIIADNAAVFFQLGDGAIVYASADAPAEYRLFMLPQQGEYANTTHFVTDATALDFFKFERLEKEILECAVLTDGLQRLALDYKTQSPHQPFFRSMLAPLRAQTEVEILKEKLVDFLASPKINERTEDDKTLVLAVRN